MYKNSKNDSVSFIKSVITSLLFGILSMLLLAFFISAFSIKIKHYEAFYPFAAFLLRLIPGFVSTRIIAAKRRNFLLLIVFVQAIAVSIAFLITAIILNGININVDDLSGAIALIFASCIVAILLPFKKTTKIKKR